MSINVTRSSMPPFEEYCDEIRGLWDSRWLTNMGCKHRQLEEDLQRYLQCGQITLFTNGHLALENILQAFRLEGEIITTPFTFASTTHAIVRCGCKPVFCDIDPVTYTLDPGKLEALITERTAAILPVHVYGNLCDTDRIGEIGSAVCCHSEEIRRRLCDLKNFGIHDEENVPYVGGNAKMNEFCAAMGICNLRHLEEEIEKRRLVREHYDGRLGGTPGLRLNRVQENTRSNNAYYPVVFDGFRLNRDEVYAKLSAEGIIPRKYFYPLTSAFACYDGWEGFDPSATPIAAQIAAQVLTLPIYADLPTDTVDRICDLILG